MGQRESSDRTRRLQMPWLDLIHSRDNEQGKKTDDIGSPEVQRSIQTCGPIGEMTSICLIISIYIYIYTKEN